MKTIKLTGKHFSGLILCSVLELALLLILIPQRTKAADWSKVETVFGRKGAVTGSLIKFGFPRSDLHVMIGDVAVQPGLALGSWAALDGSEDSAILMGDLVLLEPEIEPVIDRREAGGVTITALHNHLLQERPQVLYMHYMGHGNAEALAKTLKSALEKTGTPLKPPAAKSPVPAVHMNTIKIEEILGHHGTLNGSILSFGIPRAEPIREHGMEVPTAMGVANSINFQDAPRGVAATGDFVLIASEVNPVIRALRAAEISVTALHNHMLDDSPRLFFMHFWAQGPAPKIAAGLRSALDQINLKK